MAEYKVQMWKPASSRRIPGNGADPTAPAKRLTSTMKLDMECSHQQWSECECPLERWSPVTSEVRYAGAGGAGQKRTAEQSGEADTDVFVGLAVGSLTEDTGVAVQALQGTAVEEPEPQWEMTAKLEGVRRTEAGYEGLLLALKGLLDGTYRTGANVQVWLTEATVGG